ncbi:AraC family transcriptional regulator [Oceanimonas pelagia]|uniref:AraC family transcriptional regulator n=1 Tax=Oceanimonas pelagia TaxID=3028314 RepID=A0AA50KSI3_9GAMM|nr:AraC family transcriptional regulator [Oceanimonas pelagia]WMC12267.1 AraC family transcriptional regulator [Oceanimonas pelagia]
MPNQLSLRSYTRQRRSHAHDFHQLVLPLRGVIQLEMAGFCGKVAPGECAVIRQGEQHHFTADTQARFVVADLDALPPNLVGGERLVFAVSPPLSRYLEFIEAQLEHQVNADIERAMVATFAVLVAEQRLSPRLDARIRQVLSHIERHLTEKMTLQRLAGVACLSETQLKKLFRQQVGLTVMQYVTQKRMDKARALIQHTDYSIQLVAELVGYTDLSAFSRRFSRHFGMTPTRFSQ